METMSFVLRVKPTAATPSGGLGSHGLLHLDPRAEGDGTVLQGGRVFRREKRVRRKVGCVGARKEIEGGGGSFHSFFSSFNTHSKT